MNNVNRTLYIPLYGKAYVSRRGILLDDPWAEAIWAAERFPLKGKSRSKWLAFYMGMRAAVFDRWTAEQMAADPEAMVIHIGCGLDSRAQRVGHPGRLWFDVDFPEVIAERKKHFAGTDEYRMIPGDIRDPQWLAQVPKGRAILVMEGVSMYLSRGELQSVLRQWSAHFTQMRLLMDCYTEFAARASRYRNPIQDVGVTRVFGVDDPAAPTEGTGLSFTREHKMTPAPLIAQLKGPEQALFRALYAGKLAKKMYRLYEYR